MNNKSQKYIAIFTVLLITILVVFFTMKKDDTTSPTGTGNVVTKANQQNQNNAHAIPDVTKGDAEATINADISFREIDFSLTQDDIIEKEKKLSDTLEEPTIASSADGYTYVTFNSNPDKPINYNGFSVASSGTTCITYVFNNGNLEEARLQFGPIDDATTSGLIANINSQYGNYTFYRSSNDAETYWWKGNNAWLMLTSDSTGSTTLYLRKV